MLLRSIRFARSPRMMARSNFPCPVPFQPAAEPFHGVPYRASRECIRPSYRRRGLLAPRGGRSNKAAAHSATPLGHGHPVREPIQRSMAFEVRRFDPPKGDGASAQKIVIEVQAVYERQRLNRWRLPPGEYLIGREDGVDLQLPLPQVSRRHAVLRVKPAGTITVEDLGSSSGTSLNGEFIRRTDELPLPRSIHVADVRLDILAAAAGERRLPGDVAGEPETAAVAAALREELKPLARRRLETPAGDTPLSGTAISAHDANLERTVAIQWATPGSTESETNGFLREARLLARLQHPNIPPVHQSGEDASGRDYYTAKPPSSRTLAAFLDGLSTGQADLAGGLNERLEAFQKIADAVAFAHDKGVIHGRLHPAHIQLGDFGEVLVGGWEHATIVAPDRLGGELPDAPTTMAGEMPAEREAFQAPELASGATKQISAEADIYSLGAILHCLLNGTAPASFRRGKRSRRGALRGSPAALNAVAARAMAEEPGRRYASVADLTADLEAWKRGFATRAEGAGFVRQFLLLALRHKVVAATGLALAVMAGWFLTRVARSEREARRQVETLRGHAALFYEVAQFHKQRQEWPQALEKIRAAIELAPERADYHLLKGDIHQGMLEMEAASTAYAHAGELDPALTDARKRQEQSDGFLMETSGTTVFPFLKAAAFRRKLVEERRTDVAMGLLSRMQTEAGKVEAKLLKELKPLTSDVKFTLNEDFTIGLEISNAKRLKNLNLLAGLPIKSLGIPLCGVTNVDALSGMPLETLNLGENKVVDISPLRGLPIKSLALSRTAVTNLAPLQGMPLEYLAMLDMPVSDLSPLRGMSNLWYLNLYNAWNVKDLSPLEGLPITDLQLYSTKVANLAPLNRCPLRNLSAYFNKLSDLTPLHGLPLERLDVAHNAVTNITPLSASPIKVLRLHYTGVSDIRIVAGLKLEELTLDHCAKVRDLRPLLNVPTLKRLTVPEGAMQIPANLEIIRRLPRLEQLGSDLVMEQGDRVALKPVSEFWPAYANARLRQLQRK